MSSSPLPKIARIEIDRELCIGAATCLAVAPGVYELDEENKAIVKDMNAADYDTLLESARACPTLAIYLYDEEGNQIFPEL